VTVASWQTGLNPEGLLWRQDLQVFDPAPEQVAGAPEGGSRGVIGKPRLAVAARLLPDSAIWNGAGPAGATRQAGDQGCCGVEVRGFEPLASSVRGIFR
jgi:hypothetical protein